MKPHNESTFNAAEAFGLISKYRRLMMIGTTLGLTLFAVAAYTLPKKYKSYFTLTIYAKYFQNPLIHDFMPELSDPGEMKSERETMIRQALTPEFLDSLRRKYGIYHSKNGADAIPPGILKRILILKRMAEGVGLYHPAKTGSEEAAARVDLLTHIQIFDLNNTTFHVSFVYTDPDVTLQVTRDIYAQVIRTLLETHMNNLVTVRDAIRKRLESLAFSLTATAPDPRASIRPQVVSDELADVRNQIRALSTQYTEDHPALKALRDRERILVRWQGASSENGSEPPSGQENAVAGDQSLPTVKEIYGDLMKKMNYLNIALDADRAHQGAYFATVEIPIYPDAPLWPKKGLLALWGLALGFIGSLSIAALREYFNRTTLRADVLAERLGVPLLGVLPIIPWNTPMKSERGN